MKITKTTQIHIHTEDKPGQLAKVLGLIADAGVDINAYAGYSQPNGGHILIVTDDNEKASGVLKAAGYMVRVQQAVLVRDGDKVGTAASQTRKIAEAGINITGAYASACGGDYVTVFQSADLDGLIRALSKA